MIGVGCSVSEIRWFFVGLGVVLCIYLGSGLKLCIKGVWWVCG